MTVDRVADMTLNDLKRFVTEIVDEQLNLQHSRKIKDERSLKEVLASMDRLRWTPPPGSRTTLEMIREDRDA